MSYSTKQCLSIKARLNKGSLTNPLAPGTPSLPSEAGITSGLSCPTSIHTGSGDSNSSPYTCEATMLSTEPSLQPLSFLILFFFMVVSLLVDLVGLKFTL